jgi:hypothetical protein
MTDKKKTIDIGSAEVDDGSAPRGHRAEKAAPPKEKPEWLKQQEAALARELENRKTCEISESGKYPGQLQAEIHDSHGRVLASSPVIDEGLLGSVPRNLSNQFKDKAQLPDMEGKLTGDAIFPVKKQYEADSIDPKTGRVGMWTPVPGNYLKEDGFTADFNRAVCNVTGPQGQSYQNVPMVLDAGLPKMGR